MFLRLLLWATLLHVASACWCCGTPSCGCGCGGGGGWGYVPPQTIGYNRYPIYLRIPASQPVREKVVTVIRDEPVQPRVITRVVHEPQYIHVQAPPQADSYSVGPASYQSVQSPQTYQTVQSPPTYQTVQSPPSFQTVQSPPSYQSQPLQSPPLPSHTSYQAVQSPAVSSSGYSSDSGVSGMSTSQDFSQSFRGYVLKRVTI
uniref:DM5 domain-containing protein n=1 Tax=Steinernema glaseri TaxID=37863 RepID=A0A1I7Z2B0_9BILA